MSDRTPQASLPLTPFLRIPFTDIFGVLVTNQWNGRCGDIEMKVIDCLEAYGLDRGMKKECKLQLSDYNECLTNHKQRERTNAMRAERERQYAAGERTKENRYADPPPNDAFPY